MFFTTRNNVNGYPVLCIANRRNTPCTAENILVTLRPGSDTGEVLNQMIDFRRGVGSEPLNLSGCKLITYDEQENPYLDVKQLIDGKKCGDSNNTSKSAPVKPRF